MLITEDEARKETARKRVEQWKRMLTPDRNAIIAACRAQYNRVNGDDGELAARLLEDIADGRI